MFAAIRILIGLVFLISGIEKTLSPYQNFLYVIQAYDLLPAWGEEWTARLFPWIELFVGLFLVFGLWTRTALKAALVMFAVFITVVGQALLRGIPLDQCGCFGQLVHVSPHWIIVLDSVLLLCTAFLLRHPKTIRFSLDQYFAR
jgi:uncharacterized membrane protein YphA (DoxX/SURF4 family)